MEHWCIVSYIGFTPFYYLGYFVDGKPAYSNDFTKALKISKKEDADRLLPKVDTTAIVEQHAEADNQLTLF